MRNYLVFTLKELKECIRTHKGVILLVVFVIFGIMNPLFAKLTPLLLESLSGENIIIAVPEPTAFDSWNQFFKNISQMGFIVLIILFSGIIAQELSRGTLINMLTKGLSRASIVLAKFTMLIVVWSAAYSICFFVTLAYTVYLFPGSDVQNLAFAAFTLWLFGVLLLSFLMFAATIAKSSYACLLAIVVFVAMMMLISIAPSAHDYNPLSLATDGSQILTGAIETSALMPAIGISLVGSCILVICAVFVFRKRQV